MTYIINTKKKKKKSEKEKNRMSWSRQKEQWGRNGHSFGF